MATFGEKITDLRKKRNMSQTEAVAAIKQFANGRIRMSQTTLSALEQQQFAPRGEVVIVLAEFYKVKPIYFYRDNDRRSAARLAAAKVYLTHLRYGSMEKYLR